jgi:hypothetical protein
VVLGQAVRHRRRDDHGAARADETGRTPAHLGGQKIVDTGRQMGAVLLGRPHRQEHHSVPGGEVAQLGGGQAVPQRFVHDALHGSDGRYPAPVAATVG